MNASLISAVALLVCTTACTTTLDSVGADSELAYEIRRLESTRPEAPVRIEREALRTTSDRDAPLRPSGPTCQVRYVLSNDGTDDGARFDLRRTPSLVQVRGGGQEWFFHRNPIAHEEVTGLRVDREHALLIEYPFADLRIEGFASSWSSLARLGVDPSELSTLTRTGQTMQAFEVTFDELIDREATGNSVRELYWSDELQLPLHVVRASGLRVELEELDLGLDADAVDVARSSYTEYRIQDIADWREALHGH